MKYNPDQHALQCPKCRDGMEEVTYGNLTIDRCTGCKGLWFDSGEAEALRDRWMAEVLDTGDPKVGRKWNKVGDVDCPRCGDRMKQTSDPSQIHIWYELCPRHGIFMDAGEFTDFKYDTLVDRLRGLLTGKRPSS